MNVERASIEEIATFLMAIDGPATLRIGTSGPTLTGRVRKRLDYCTLPEESPMKSVFKLQLVGDDCRYHLVLRYEDSELVDFAVERTESAGPRFGRRTPVPWSV